MDSPTKKILEQIRQTNQISRRHYGQLVSLMLSSEVSSPEKFYLNQIFDKLQLGQITFTN